MKLNISKTLFFDYLRCPAYAPLFHAYKDRNAIIDNEISESDLLSLENFEKTRSILENFIDPETGEDLTLKDDLQTKTFQELYKKIEKYASEKAKLLWNFNQVEQAYYKINLEGYNFYAFLDLYLESENEIKIVEVKSSSNSKIKSFLNKSKDNIFNLDLEKLLFERKKIESLFDPFSDFRFLTDISFQRNILENDENFNPKKKKVSYYIALINSDYIFDGKQNINGDNIYNNDIISFIEVSNFTKYFIDNYLPDMLKKVIDNLNNMKVNKINLSKNCMRNKNRECKFFKYCMERKSNPEKNNLFSLYFYHTGFNLNGEKIDFYSLLNNSKYKTILDIDDLINFNYKKISKSTEKRKVQFNALKNDQEYIQKEYIKAFIGNLKYPIYHLDFETLSLPIPLFKGEKPYTQSPFQYSIHIERKPSECDNEKDNISFLAESPFVDQRKEIAKSLAEILTQDEGSIIAYNATFEKRVLQYLSEQFPEYAEKLKYAISKLKDLQDIFTGSKLEYFAPFYKNEVNLLTYGYYNHRLQGKTSIKKVLPVFTNLSYDNLEIGNGVEAFCEFYKSGFLDKKSSKYLEYRKHALTYCMQDTYSMFLILKKLRSLI